NLINEYDLDNVTPVQVAKMEYYYAQAQIYAYLIASHYRKAQRYHEAQGRQQRANLFEEIRKERSAADADALSRRVEGEQEEIAGRYEANYLRWYGIAQSYEHCINSLKDLGKAIMKEGG
ncbi:MAG: hypothetical protein IRZ03_18120, partial [Acidobacterium ailaaui]|nr:hypothetical protein [Pseudacidobacterium ailaaui]